MREKPGFEDWQAICEAKAQYCRYLDAKDWEAFTELFTEDFEMDVSEGTGVEIIQGRDAAIAMVRSTLETAKTAHQVHNPEMTWEGDVMHVTWAMQDRVIWSEEQSLTGYGNYHEKWVKQKGQWKISTLRLTRFIVELKLPPAVFSETAVEG